MRSDLEKLNRDIEWTEVKQAFKRMKNGKAAGEDGVAIEFLRRLPEVGLTEMREVLNGGRSGGRSLPPRSRGGALFGEVLCRSAGRERALFLPISDKINFKKVINSKIPKIYKIHLSLF